MAYMRVVKYEDIGTGGSHHSTSWQFALDKEFTKIIDQSLKDKVNVKEWHSPLPKRPEHKSSPDAEEYYNDLDELWGRMMIHVGETDSEWLVVGPRSQKLQRVLVTDNSEDEDVPEDKLEYMSNSTELGWTEGEIPDDDDTILTPIIPEPEVEEEESKEDQVVDSSTGGDGTGGDPVFVDKEDSTKTEEEPSVSKEEPSTEVEEVTPEEEEGE